MNIELVEAGIKITLDPEERNVVRTHSKLILSQIGMQVKILTGICIAVDTLGEDRLHEILENRGLLDENADLSLSNLGRLVEEIMGKDAINRIIESGTKNDG